MKISKFIKLLIEVRDTYGVNVQVRAAKIQGEDVLWPTIEGSPENSITLMIRGLKNGNIDHDLYIGEDPTANFSETEYNIFLNK